MHPGKTRVSKRFARIFMHRIYAEAGSQFFRHSALLLHWFQKGDLGCSRQPGQLQHQKPYHSATDHHRLAAGPYPAHINTVEAAGHRFCHGTHLKGGVFPQPVDLLFIHRTVLGKSSVHSGSVALHMLTKVNFSTAAGRTRPAIRIGIDADPIPRLPPFDRIACLHHNP